MYKEENLFISKEGGHIYCDGVIIDNVHLFYIDYADDEIHFEDNKGNEVGSIYHMENREICYFCEYQGHNFNDHHIIKNGKVVIE